MKTLQMTSTILNPEQLFNQLQKNVPHNTLRFDSLCVRLDCENYLDMARKIKECFDHVIIELI